MTAASCNSLLLNFIEKTRSSRTATMSACLPDIRTVDSSRLFCGSFPSSGKWPINSSATRLDSWLILFGRLQGVGYCLHGFYVLVKPLAIFPRVYLYRFRRYLFQQVRQRPKPGYPVGRVLLGGKPFGSPFAVLAILMAGVAKAHTGTIERAILR